jgi:hypothetical protein
MNTPSHAILNVAILSNVSPLAGAIAFGAILPDLPIFGFYIWAKWIARLPEQKIWSEGYYYPVVQDLVAFFHSIPIAFLGWLIAFFAGWDIAQVVCLSCVLHSLGDLPVHNSDAHRHFFPLTDYRFISPVSYWDPKHYGSIAAAVELGLVSAATVWVFPRTEFWLARVLLVTVNVLYGWGYYRFYRRSWQRVKSQTEE